MARKNPSTTKTSSTPEPDPVTKYALETYESKDSAGPLVRAACLRHLEDLKHGHERGLKWRWVANPDDSPEIKKAIEENGGDPAIRGTGKHLADFFESELHLSEGVPFVLAPPLMFAGGSLFGWKRFDNFRRFRMAYEEIGKGNAKTTFGAGVSLYMLVADGEPRADCFIAATDKDQAKIPFRDAVNFVNLNENLDSILKRSGSPGSEWNLAYLKNGSYLRPISSESKGRGKSGFRPHFVLLDEVHEHPTSMMWDLARANLKTRNQPLIFAITNTGKTDPGAVWYQLHEHGERMLLGQDQNNDSEFFYICGLDKGDDWRNPAVWKKGNPMLGIIPGMERYLGDAVANAKGMPSKQAITRQLNFCEQTGSLAPLFEKETWDACGGRVDLERLKGRKCFGGLDLSSKNDLTALALIFEPEERYEPIWDCTECGFSTGDYEPTCPTCQSKQWILRHPVQEKNRKDILIFAWTPGDTLREHEEKDRAPYQQWVEEGYLLANPGKTIQFSFVARKIAKLLALYEVECIAFDRHRIEDMERELLDADANVVLKPWGQGFVDMNPALQALEEDVLTGVLRHGDNPLLTWAINNVKVVSDAAGNRKFDKEKSTGHIDPAQSVAMASGLMASQPADASYAVTLI